MEDGLNSKVWTVREGKLASGTVFNESHITARSPERKHRVRRDLHDRRGTPTVKGAATRCITW